jgi:hypothetical protein
MLLAPDAGSSKFQDHLESSPPATIVDLSEKMTGAGKQTVGARALATGSGFTKTVFVMESLQPAGEILYRETWNEPAVPYVWGGFCIVERLFTPDEGSPKFQDQFVIGAAFRVERSVNKLGLFRQTVVELNLTAGTAFTVTVCGIEFVQPNALVTVNVAVKLPAAVYVCEGFGKPEVLLAEVGSPKFQAQVVAEVDKSVKCIGGVLKQTGIELKLATGVGSRLYVITIAPFPPADEVPPPTPTPAV